MTIIGIYYIYSYMVTTFFVFIFVGGKPFCLFATLTAQKAICIPPTPPFSNILLFFYNFVLICKVNKKFTIKS